jgi:hypothetical protein
VPCAIGIGLFGGSNFTDNGLPSFISVLEVAAARK